MNKASAYPFYVLLFNTTISSWNYSKKKKKLLELLGVCCPHDHMPIKVDPTWMTNIKDSFGIIEKTLIYTDSCSNTWGLSRTQLKRLYDGKGVIFIKNLYLMGLRGYNSLLSRHFLT